MNVFPISATIDGRTHRDCRLVAYLGCDHGDAVLWSWPGRDRKPFPLLRVADATTITVDGVAYTLDADDRPEPIVVHKQDGCGCGAKLKTYHPPCPTCLPTERRHASRA